MTLAQSLSGRSGDAQGALARAASPGAALDELLDALDLDPLSEWAMLHITDELVQRGAEIIAPIAARLVERPERRAAYALAEALTELFRAEPPLRPALIAALVAAGEAALRSGAPARSARTYAVHLADCARIAEAELPEARGFAAAYLDRMRSEAADAFGASEAAFLLDGGSASVAGGGER